MKTGHIRITDKIYFEPDGLEKPNWDILSDCFIKHGYDVEDIKGLYNEKMKAYEASKQLVEVENAYWSAEYNEWWLDPMDNYDIAGRAKNNQPCKAEINNNKVIIIELL